MPPGNLRRQAHPPPTKQNVSFALFIAARQSPPTGAPEPLKAKRQFCANTGQGRMSLAGAGRSPHNYCRQAISADRQSPPTGAPEPHKAKRQFCAFYCRKAPRRQASPQKSRRACIKDKHTSRSHTRIFTVYQPHIWRKLLFRSENLAFYCYSEVSFGDAV